MRRGEPPLLGMDKLVSEDSLRRNLARIDEAAGLNWLQNHLDYLHGALAERAPGARHRYHGEAVVRAPGRRRGWTSYP